MSVLQPFLIQCVPDDVHPLYNSAVDLLITYQHTTAYNALIELTSEQSDPYAPYHRDTVNGILMDALPEIIHDHGIIAQGQLHELVKLGQSIKHLTESPELDVIVNALEAFPDSPADCMQRALEGHGGHAEWDFHAIVQLVTPSCITRLQQHAMRTEELLEQQLLALDEDLPNVDPNVEVTKREWLVKHKDHPDMQIVMGHIKETQCSIGHTIEDLVEDLREELNGLTNNPQVAAGTLFAIVVLSDTPLNSAYQTAVSHVETIWDDPNFTIDVKSKLSTYVAEGVEDE